MTTSKFLDYRGDLQALAAIGETSSLALVTVHAENQPTALYRLDTEKMTLAAAELPCGGRAVLADGALLWIAGTDGRLYRFSEKDKNPTAIGDPFEQPVSGLALLSENRLAALALDRIVVLDRKTGKARQTIALSESGLCLTADPGGQWLVAGGAKGTVFVFSCEDREEFVLSESARLHEGAVTALLFEPSELRFFSAGLDQKLLLTHARGKLEPEDRGRGGNHSERVTAMILAPGERFLTGGFDATVKTWTRSGASRPATLKDGVGKVAALAIVTVHNRQQLAVACQDNSLRFFVLDAAGKFGQPTATVYDVYAWADNELQQAESSCREAALKKLAELNDAPAVERLARRVAQDEDHALRLLAAQLLSEATHPRAAGELEKHFQHGDEAVRRAVFEGLRKRLGAGDLRPLDLALATGQADLGAMAIQALEELAPADDQALARLVKALDGKPYEVRFLALVALERLHDPHSPAADLLALESKQADLRRVALARLYQRGLLGSTSVASALRRAGEDADPRVRQTAFLVLTSTRQNLVRTLRERDEEFDRQFKELESLQDEEAKPAESPAAKEKKAPKKKAKPAAKAAAEGVLAPQDVDPLLQASASRMLDTCLRGARGLALLEDPRALGLLMQLSREQDAAARVEVCRALGALDDPRSVKRLRSLLGDKAPEVRDAAFTALARLYESQPLTAADAGLSAVHEDVRRRGLEILVREVRKKAPKGRQDAAWDLVRRALNDSFPAVRGETFKAAVNLGLGGGGAETLRLVLECIHEDVRREALREITAQADQPWSQELLLECLNDPAPALRAEAFAVAGKRAKPSDLSYLERALTARWDDVRREAVQSLVKKHTQAAQRLLATALDDEDLNVRQQALEGLVELDAEEPLANALASRRLDVRVRAATALARRGDLAALAPLVEMALADEPPETATVEPAPASPGVELAAVTEAVQDPRQMSVAAVLAAARGKSAGAAPPPPAQAPPAVAETAARRQAHHAVVAAALLGLAELGEPAALAAVLTRLHHQEASVREAAAKALVWTVRGDSLDAARESLRSADLQVKYRAALALAYWGDASAASLVFSEAGQKLLDAKERLAAALALESVAEDQLTAFLDHANDTLRTTALLLLLLLELKDHDGSPQRCLAALSSEHPRVRLIAARAMESFADSARFRDFITKVVNDRGDQPAWTISPDDVETLAAMAAQAGPLLRARTAGLLLLWGEPKQEAWDQAWRTLCRRFEKEIEEARQQAQGHSLPDLKYDEPQLRELAFGAYVGLVREQGAAPGRSGAAGPLILRVRQTALRRIFELASAEGTFRDAARPVLLQALGDPNQDVRMQAFEHLQALGMENAALGAEAIASGHNDLAVRGMMLLTEGASPEVSAAILEQVMLARTDQLALEAARLLVARQGAVKTAEKALGASWEALPRLMVSLLAVEYDQNAQAKKLLHQALESRHRDVRFGAALILADKKDPQALEALAVVLNEPQWTPLQTAAANALQQLGDPRAAELFLDRIEAQPAGKGQLNALFPLAGAFRNVKIAPRLLGMMDKKEWRLSAFKAALAIAGYDQPLEDPQEERLDQDWLKKQHPRRDDLLAELAERCLALGETNLLLELIPGLRWAKDQVVDSVLATLAFHSEPRVRHAALEAIGWRVRKRGAAPGSLLKALEHRDAETKFHAAEALARSGRGEGLSILLAGVELMSDLDLRRRAVRALGELADERALGLLLKLAGEDAHALQEDAAEALGRLGQSDQADEIFKILQRLAGQPGGVAASAIRGLRYFNTAAGWKVVRERLRDTSFRLREVAAEALGYNDDPHTRDLLLEVLARDVEGGDVPEAALRSARRLFGPESLEPDYAFLQNPELDIEYVAEDKDALARVCLRGEPGRILAILPEAHPSALEPLAESLFRRDEPQLKEAQQALAGQHPETVQIAAGILGRAADKKTAKAVAAALETWRGAWETRRQRMAQGNNVDYVLTAAVTPCLTRLVWAAGRLGAPEEALIAAARDRPGDPYFSPIRLAAVTALCELAPTKNVLEALAAIAAGEDAEARALAASALARSDPQRAASQVEGALSDRVALNRLTANPEVNAAPALRTAAASVHYQGAALPHLIAAGDLDTLFATADDKSLPDTTRLGAIEALARLAQEDAESKLVALGQDQDNDEELRKAAWRGRRRSQRARVSHSLRE